MSKESEEELCGKENWEEKKGMENEKQAWK